MMTTMLELGRKSHQRQRIMKKAISLLIITLVITDDVLSHGDHDHAHDDPHDHPVDSAKSNNSSDDNSELGDNGNIKSPLPWHEHIHEEDNVSTIFNVSLDAVAVEESLFFVRKLFRKYGDGGILTRSDLLELMAAIGMDKEKIKGGDLNHVVTRSIPDPSHIHSAHDEDLLKDNSTNLSLNRCATITEMLSDFHMASSHHVTPQEFSYLCPAILYQLDLDVCRSHDHSHDHSHEGHKHGSLEHEPDDLTVESLSGDQHSNANLGDIQPRVWGYSCLAVFIISLVGLLGVAVIPIMQKVFYNHLLQFLVALAIGALTGDALLHLLPHSIMAESGHSHGHDSHDGHSHGAEETEEEHEHRMAAWKGLVALVGILFFFIMERLLTIITIIRRNKNSEKQKKKKRCMNYCDMESNKKCADYKLSRRQPSEDGCDRAMVVVHPNKDGEDLEKYPALRVMADDAHDEIMHQCNDDSPGQDFPSPIFRPKIEGNGVAKMSNNHHNHHSHNHHQQQPMSGDEDNEDVGDNVDGRDVERMEMMAGNGSDIVGPVSSGHSHGSHHGHAHSVPNSVAAVAWMVILGDGIHNFSDGLAIGAAFASSITGGISTSIAVFCHELPHEIGDFAVLLRAGMTPKQAIMYNCLSSILCFIGMLIGVAIGNITSASEWIFALVGGMFLYIALVDMLPEMTSVDPQKGENPFLHLLLQVMGIVLGSSIMLVIAMFEHDIKRLLD